MFYHVHDFNYTHLGSCKRIVTALQVEILAGFRTISTVCFLYDTGLQDSHTDTHCHKTVAWYCPAEIFNNFMGKHPRWQHMSV